MKRKYNAQQTIYMVCKAQLDALKEQETAIEQTYIKEHGISNPDGEPIAHIWQIDDESTFNTANEATAPAIDALHLYDAEQALRAAEDALINYGLSIAPTKEREILRKPCFGLDGDYVHIDIRAKVINLAMSLDASTVRR